MGYFELKGSFESALQSGTSFAKSLRHFAANYPVQTTLVISILAVVYTYCLVVRWKRTKEAVEYLVEKLGSEIKGKTDDGSIETKEWIEYLVKSSRGLKLALSVGIPMMVCAAYMVGCHQAQLAHAIRQIFPH